jgi:CrcB protein
MSPALLVVVGGAAGSLARWALAGAVDGRLPWGTLLVNLTGCAAIGAAAALAGDRAWVKPLVMAGFLGGFTTYSAWSLQVLGLFQEGRIVAAVGYAGATAVGCVLACWLGWTLARLSAGS